MAETGKFSGRLVVVVNGPHTPGGPEWQAFIAGLEQVARPEEMRAFVLTLGGTPTADQRVQLGAISRAVPIKVALLSDSFLARLFTNCVVRLVNRNVRVFRAHQWQEGFDFLDLRPRERIFGAGLLREAMEEMKLTLLPGLDVAA